MPDHKILKDLKQCMRGAHSDADRNACQLSFEQAGGKVTQAGGKIFTAPDGSQAIIQTGGKIFSPEA